MAYGGHKCTLPPPLAHAEVIEQSEVVVGQVALPSKGYRMMTLLRVGSKVYKAVVAAPPLRLLEGGVVGRAWLGWSTMRGAP